MDNDVLQDSQKIVFAINRIKSKINIDKWKKAFEYRYKQLQELGLQHVNYKKDVLKILNTLTALRTGYIIPSIDPKDLEKKKGILNMFKNCVKELDTIDREIVNLVQVSKDKGEYVANSIHSITALYYKCMDVIKKNPTPFTLDALKQGILHDILFKMDNPNEPLHNYYSKLISLEEDYKAILKWAENNSIQNAQKTVHEAYVNHVAIAAANR